MPTYEIETPKGILEIDHEGSVDDLTPAVESWLKEREDAGFLRSAAATTANIALNTYAGLQSAVKFVADSIVALPRAVEAASLASNQQEGTAAVKGIYDDLKAIGGVQMGEAETRQQAQEMYDFYKANPQATNIAAQLGRGVGTAIALLPSIAGGELPLAAGALGGAADAYSASYSGKENQLRSEGMTDEKKIQDEAEKEGTKAAIKTVPGLAAYMLGGKLSAGILSKYLPETWSPIAKALATGTGAAATNVTVGSLLRQEAPTPETLTVDILLGASAGAERMVNERLATKAEAAGAPLTAEALKTTAPEEVILNEPSTKRTDQNRTEQAPVSGERQDQGTGGVRPNAGDTTGNLETNRQGSVPPSDEVTPSAETPAESTPVPATTAEVQRQGAQSIEGGESNASSVRSDEGQVRQVNAPLESQSKSGGDLQQQAPEATRGTEQQVTSFTTSQGSTYKVEGSKTTRTKSLHEGHLPSDVGEKQQSQHTVYVDPDFAREVGMWGTGSNSGKRIVLGSDGKVTLVSRNPNTGQQGRDPTVGNPAYSNVPKVGLSPLELWDFQEGGGFRGNHPGSPITEVITAEPTTAKAETAPTHPPASTPTEGAVIGEGPASGKGTEPVTLAQLNDRLDKVLQKHRDLKDETTPEGRARKSELMTEAKDLTAQIVKLESQPATEPAPKIPKGLQTDPTVEKLLSGEFTAETKLKSPRKTEGGAIFGGAFRKKVPTVGSTPTGSKDWIRIPSGFKRLATGLERHGSADVLEKQKNPVAKVLATAIKKHVDIEQEIYGREISKMNTALKGLSRKATDRAFDEIEGYLRAKENGRTLPPISPTAQKIVDAWFDIGRDTGNIARAHNVMVFDPKSGGYRGMGTVKDYVPRMFRGDVELVLQDPQRNPTLFNDLAQSIATHKGITLEDAAAELRGVASRFQANDFMGNVEMARTEQLPEVFYEYDLRNLMARYLPSYSERLAQIIAYGQRLGPRDAPLRENLWDVARKEAEDTASQTWLRHAEDQSANLRQRSAVTVGAIRAQTLANAYLLADPLGTVMRNVLSGGAATTELFGVRRSLAKVIAATKEQNRMDAREIGSVRDNIADYLHSDQLGHSFVDDAIRAVTSATLKYSGYTGSEVFVRTHNGLVASQYAKDAAAALSGPKISGLGKEALAMFKRMGIDAAKVVAEKGDWKTGEETRRFIRTAIREMQGGYRFDQVPLWANSPAGRFFYQYGRWGVQRARHIARNIIQPLIGTEVQWNGKTMTVRNVTPAVRTAIGVVLLGEAFAAFAGAVFGRDRRDSSLHEIKAAFDEDTKKGLMLAGERVINDIIMAGTLGIWSQPVGFAKNITDQNRFKNPAEPPSLAGLNAVVDLATKYQDQGGQLTRKDLEDFANQMGRGGKNISDVIRNVMDEPLYEAQNDLRTIRASAKRWAVQAGLDVVPKMTGDIRKSANAPVYEPITEALLVGDSTKARQLAAQFIASQKDPEDAFKAVKSSVRSRQPFRAGPFYSEEHLMDFIKWAKKNLNEDDLQQVARIQYRYMKAAVDAGLMKL